MLQLAAGLMNEDPVRGSVLTGMAIGSGKPAQRKLDLALATYLGYMSMRLGKDFDSQKFINTPPPKLKGVMTKMIAEMEKKGYD